jgi:23S rRNA (adenine2030-N6)-methyltransferase
MIAAQRCNGIASIEMTRRMGPRLRGDDSGGALLTASHRVLLLRMNYRHAFHAGGFADVIKHIVLVRILTHLQDKPAAFRVIDSHAGAGRYDLSSDEARRGGEWRTGIARIMQARFSETVLPLITPYLDIVRAFNPPRELAAYPGSPLIARAMLRPQDRMVACEVEPKARKQLIDALRRDTQARVVELDGWVALPAFVPPKERRGLVLIDPAFEQKDEFQRLADGFAKSFAKWPTGSYLLWYPVKSRRATDGLARQVADAVAKASVPGKCLRLEFSVAPQTAGGALTSSGLLIVNPPWKLADELKLILPELEKPLGQGGAGRFRLEAPKS